MIISQQVNWSASDGSLLLSVSIPEPASSGSPVIKFLPYTVTLDQARECALAFASAVNYIENLPAIPKHEEVFN